VRTFFSTSLARRSATPPPGRIPVFARIDDDLARRFLDRVHQAVSLLKILDRLLTDFILELYRSGPCRV
jgi:hypothetical protein